MLSIIVPVFNVQDFIYECISSIIELEIDYELIIVDDGSTDSSISIINDLIKDRENVKLLRQKNRGLSSARNEGLKVAFGDFVYFVDSDDKIDSKNIKIVYEFIMQKSNIDVAIANFYNYEKNVSSINQSTIRCDFLEGSGSTFLEKYYLKQILTVVWRNIYRRKFLLDNGLCFKEGTMYEDVEWSPRVLVKASSVVYLNIPIYYYRKRDGSFVNTNFTIKKLHDIFSVSDSLIAFSSSLDRNKSRMVIHTSVMFFLCLGSYYAKRSKVLTLEDRRIIKKNISKLNCSDNRFFILKISSRLFFPLFLFLLKFKFKD